MKKTSLIFLSILSCLLFGCNSNGGNPSNGDNNPGGEINGGSIDNPGDEDPIEDSSTIDRITMSETTLDIEINKQAKYLYINIYPETVSLEGDDIIWASSNENVATVNQYGGVVGKSVGSALITCTTKVDNRVATCHVYVHESLNDIEKKFVKVDDVESLQYGDLLIIGCPQASLAASTTIYQGAMTPTSLTYSNDNQYITGDITDVAQFTLLGEYDNWLLENQNNQLLCGQNLKNITFVNNKGNIKWMFEINEDGYLGIMNSNPSIDGWLMFNTKANKITLYDTESEQIDMFFPSLYKQIIIR